MDELLPYQLAPTNVGVEGYFDPLAAMQTSADAYTPQSIPQPPAVQQFLPPGGATAPATTTSRWDSILSKASADPNFSPETFDALASQYRDEYLTPKAAMKKMSEANFTAYIKGFEAKAARQKAELFPDAVPVEGQLAEGEGDIGYGRELAANFLGSVARTIPGVIGLADLGIRALPGVEGRTVVGDVAAGIDRTITGVMDANTSEATKRQRLQIAEAIENAEDGEEIATAIEQYLGHGRNLGTLLAQGVGSLVPGAGAAALLGKAGRAGQAAGAGRLAQAANRVSQSPFGRTATVATGAGAPLTGAQAVALESSLLETPLAELVTDGDYQTLYDTLKTTGLSDPQIEKQLQHKFANDVMKYYVPAALAGNVGLAMIPGLNVAERVIGNTFAGATRQAGAAAPGVIRRAVTGIASEGTQEGAAASLERGGENIGRGIPLSTGMVESVVPEAIAGALIGGGVNVGLNRNGRPAKDTAKQTAKDKLKRRAGAPATPAQEGPQGASSQPAAPVAEQGQEADTGAYDALPATPMAEEPLVKVRAKLTDGIAKKLPRIKKAVTAATTPIEYINQAEVLAQSNIGADWTKLDATQRVDMVESVVEQLNKLKPIAGIGEAFTAYKQTTLQVPAPGAVVETDVVEQLLAQEEAEEEAAAVAQTPPVIAPAPVVTPPPQQAKKSAKKTVARAALQGPAPVVETPPKKSLGKRKVEPKVAKPVAPDNKQALLNNYLAYISDKSNLVAPAYADIIRRDLRLDAARKALSAGTITDTKTLSAFLESEAANLQTTSPETRPEDNRLVSAILGDKKLKKASTAKTEARTHMTALKGLVSDEDMRKMTLAQLREVATKVQADGLKDKKTETAKKKVKKAVDTAKKDSKPAEEAPRPKTVAPAEGANVAPVTDGETVAPKTKKVAKAPKPRTVNEKVRDHFTNLAEPDLVTLTAAIELAQEGDNSELKDAISDLGNDIKADDKTWLRKLAREAPKPVRQVMEEQIEEEIKEIEAVEATGVPLELEDVRPVARPTAESESDANFKEWTNGLDIIKLDALGEYVEGPAVFSVVHGTTHTDIEQFDTAPNIGTEQGYMGKGAYFTNSTADAAANYANVKGPDLVSKVSYRTFEIQSDMEGDKHVFTELLSEYIQDKLGADEVYLDGKDYFVDEIPNSKIEKAKEEYLTAVAEWQANRELKGDSDGVTYPVYVRLDNPYAPAGLSSIDNRKELDTLLEAITEVGSNWDIEADTTDGVVAELLGEFLPRDNILHATIDSIFRGNLEIYTNLEGEDSSVGQFIQEVMREAGYDGTIMDAGSKFTAMVGMQPGTIHVMPFNGTQIKSVFNLGKWSKVDGRILYDKPLTKAALLKRLDLQIKAQKNNQPPTRKGSARAATENVDQLRQQQLTSDDLLEELNITPEGQVARGVASVRRTLQTIADSGKATESQAAKFALWLIDRNPGLATDLAIITKDRGTSSAGYNPLQMIASLNRRGFSTNSIVHEILHHSERMLPSDVQDKIRGEYAGRFINKYKQVTKKGNTAAIAYLEDVLKYNTNPTDENRRAALKHILDREVNADEFYKYFSPSEYWAETASETLARKHGADSWIAKAKEWLRGFAQQVKDFLGLDNEAEVYRALRALADTTGKQQSEGQLDSRKGEQLDIRGAEDLESSDEDEPFEQTEAEADAEAGKKRAKAKDAKGVSTLQRMSENLANHVIAFEEGIINLEQAGGEVSFDTDPSRQYRRYNGKVSYNNDKDFKDVVQPVKEWMEANWAVYGHDVEEFVDHLNRFFGNTNFLERIQSHWVENVPLDKGREVERVDIIEDMRIGEISPTVARERLTKLANKYATKPLAEHALDSGISQATYDALTSTLAELDAEYGINQESMTELNTLLDDVRDRQRQRLVESGQVSKDDPWIEFYGWKWYVPLKGAATGAVDIASQNAFDLIPQDKLSLAKLNKQMEVMEGRKTFGQRPFERLFVDLSRAGERSAHHEFIESLYELTLNNEQLMGAKIHIFNGTPRNGYTMLGDTSNQVFQRLPKPRNGVGYIFNDGDVHYVVSLPKSSQIARGLTLMNALKRPGPVSKFVSKGTNFLARMYTTASPSWQTATGFVREFTTLPFTVGVENFSSPIQARHFMLAFYKELLNIHKAAKTFIPSIKGDKDNTIEELARNDPEGYASWMVRWLQAGGANNFTEGFELDGANKLFTDTKDARLARLANAEGIDKLKAASKVGGLPLKWLLEYTGNYANFLEQIPRTAAFKALIESEGLSDAEAAIKVRQVLDYQQTGLYGRSVNSWLAFFRIAMTSMDTIRRLFRNRKTGGVDWHKVTTWMGGLSGVSMGAYYVAAAMLGVDDDGEDRIRKIRANTLTQRFVVPTGDGEPISIPIGLGLPQLLLAPGTLTAAWLNGHITYGEAVEEMYATILRNGPIMAGGVKDPTPTNVFVGGILGFSPTVISPMIALDRNVDFFGRPVHSDFPDDSRPAYLQGRSTTADMYKDIAKSLYDMSDGNVNYYPEDIRFLMVSYGGQNVADLLKGTVDRAAREDVGLLNQLDPITGRFVVQDEKYYDQERMYKLLDRAADSTRRYNAIRYEALEDGASKAEAKSKADAVFADLPAERAVMDAKKQLDKVKDARNKRIRELSRDRLTSDTRKEFIRKEEDRKMREATQQLEKALEQL